MPSNKQTRERQLAKLAARRQAGRRKKRRQRVVAGVVGVAVAVLGLGAGVYAITRGGGSPSSAGSPTPSASATAAGGVACGGTVPKAASDEKPSFKKAPKDTLDASKTYTARVVTSCGTIEFELDPGSAPNTVSSFVFLAKRHYYDGLIFHRIVPDFVIQGGDPTGTGSGGPGYKTVDAPPKDAKYVEGVVAMAKGGDEPSGTSGSQFFVVVGKDVGLPPDYAIIGKVTKGQDVAKIISALPIENGASDGRPTQTVYISKITIVTS